MWNNSFKIVAKEEDIKKISTDNLQRDNTLYVEVLKNREGKVELKDWLDWNGNTRYNKKYNYRGASGVKQTLPETKKISF